jgi:hypothetical protein
VTPGDAVHPSTCPPSHPHTLAPLPSPLTPPPPPTPPPPASIQIKYEPQPQPRCITALAGHKIVKVATGGNHAVAVSSEVRGAFGGAGARLVGFALVLGGRLQLSPPSPRPPVSHNRTRPPITQRHRPPPSGHGLHLGQRQLRQAGPQGAAGRVHAAPAGGVQQEDPRAARGRGEPAAAWLGMQFRVPYAHARALVVSAALWLACQVLLVPATSNPSPRTPTHPNPNPRSPPAAPPPGAWAPAPSSTAGASSRRRATTPPTRSRSTTCRAGTCVACCSVGCVDCVD